MLTSSPNLEGSTDYMSNLASSSTRIMRLDSSETIGQSTDGVEISWKMARATGKTRWTRARRSKAAPRCETILFKHWQQLLSNYDPPSVSSPYSPSSTAAPACPIKSNNTPARGYNCSLVNAYNHPPTNPANLLLCCGCE